MADVMLLVRFGFRLGVGFGVGQGQVSLVSSKGGVGVGVGLGLGLELGRYSGRAGNQSHPMVHLRVVILRVHI